MGQIKIDKIAFFVLLMINISCKKNDPISNLKRDEGAWNLKIVTKKYLNEIFTGETINEGKATFYNNGFLEINTNLTGIYILKWSGNKKEMIVNDRDNIIKANFYNILNNRTFQEWNVIWFNKKVGQNSKEEEVWTFFK